MNIRDTVKFLIGISFATFVLSTNSCTYKNAEEVYPCVTGNVSFSKDVQPIIVNHCYFCHSSGNELTSGGGYCLEGYSNDSLQASPAKGDILYGNISDPKITDKSHMPKNAPSLSPCEIATIKAWIDEGYQNN